MRIAHLSHFPPQSKFGRLLNSFIESLSVRRVESVIITPDENQGKEGNGLPTPFALSRILKDQRVRGVHIHHPEWLKTGTLAARLAGIPVVVTQYGRLGKDGGNIYWHLCRFVVCDSQDAKMDLVQKVRFLDKKISVIYNGVMLPPPISPDERQALRCSLGLNPEDFVLGNIAGLVPEEDQSSLIKALRKLRQKKLNVVLLIYGQGTLASDLCTQAAGYGLEGQVRILDPLEDFSRMCQAFDAFVLSSIKWSRPHSLCAAMSSNLAVVATSIGANPEVIVERQTGFLVPCGFPEKIDNAVMRMNAVEGEARRMGKAARRWVEGKFSLDVTAKTYVELYKQL